VQNLIRQRSETPARLPRADWEGQILSSHCDSGRECLSYGISAEHNSQRKRGATDRPNLRRMAPVLDPTISKDAIHAQEFAGY